MTPKQIFVSPTDGTSERFRSLCESTVLDVTAQASPDAILTYTLIGIGRDGAQSVIYQKNFRADGSGMARISHEFDPVSLAIYQNAIEFFFRIDGSASKLSAALTENEQIAVQIQAAKTRRRTKKREKRPLKKVLFIGNSILVGMEGRYGMCATSPTSDYAHHLSKEILEHYPDCQFLKFYGSPLEHAESLAAFEELYATKPNECAHAPLCECLTEDLDLIVLQLTDNVNTEQKVGTFSQTAALLLERIRSRCPNAAIVWAYGWFHKPAFFPRLLELCELYDVEQADLRGCRCKANEATAGQSYLCADGTQKTVKNEWITHPGDGGMKAIAEQILTTLREASIL